MTKPINKITEDDVFTFRAICMDLLPNALDDYQLIAGKSAIYPGQGTAIGLAYCGIKLTGEAGECAEHIGKAMRDDELIYVEMPNEYSDADSPIAHIGELKQARREAIAKELGDQLWYIAAAARELGYTLSEIALLNLIKLADRTKRDALRGRGDER